MEIYYIPFLFIYFRLQALLCNYVLYILYTAIIYTVLLRNNLTQNMFETSSTGVPAAVGAQTRRPLHEVGLEPLPSRTQSIY